MQSARIFKSNTSQAVRFPKQVALPDSVKEVDIIAMGRARLVVPSGEGWDSWFDGEAVTDDFMELRDQPEGQARESL